MNSRILNKVVLQSLRQGHHCRFISVQQNISKCSSTCHTVNFHRKKENRSLNLVLSSNRTLCQPVLQIHTSFQRNLSVTSQLSQAASVEQLKKAVDVATPTGQVTQNVTASVEQVKQAVNVATPTGEVTQNVAASVEQVKKAVEVAPPTGNVTNVTETANGWITPDATDNLLIEHAQHILVQIHEATGLPWWASIALSAFLLRVTITLPFAITQARLLAKFEKVNMTMVDTESKLKKETIKAQKEYGWPEKLTKEKFAEARSNAFWKLVNKENCHPARMYFLIAVQGSVWISASVATATLCHANIVGQNIYNQMTTGGFGWITDLTVVDPYLVFPVALGIVNLCIVEVHHAFKVDRTSYYEQWKIFLSRVISLGMIPLAASTPAAVNVYWLSSSIYGLLQALLLNSSPMRRLCRIPMNDPELKYPYRYFMKNMKTQLSFIKKELPIAAK